MLLAATVAAVSAAVFPDPLVGNDLTAALVWGDQLLHGELHGFLAGHTPHPLTIATGAAFAPLGDDAAYRIHQVLYGHLALGALTAATFDVGWRLVSPLAGVGAALLTVTSAPILLWSFHVTADASEALYQQFTPFENLLQGGRDLWRYLGPVGLSLAALGMLAAARAALPGTAPVAAVLVCTLAIFAALVALGMSSNSRYLLVPASILAVIAGVGVALAMRSTRRPFAVAAVITAVLLFQGLIGANVASRIEREAATRSRSNEDLRSLGDEQVVRRVLGECATVAAPTVRMIPVAAFFTARAPDRWLIDERGRTHPQAFLAPATKGPARIYLTRPRFDRDPRFLGARAWQRARQSRNPRSGTGRRDHRRRSHR